MSFISKVREAFRNKTREDICAHLRGLGIAVQMAPRGRAEEKIYTGPRRSFGVVDITEGPIRWVNVTSATVAWGGSDDDTGIPHYLVYGFPDVRVRSLLTKNG